MRRWPLLAGLVLLCATGARGQSCTSPCVTGAGSEDIGGGNHTMQSAAAMNVTAGNFLAVGCGNGSTSTMTVSDTAGNAFTALTVLSTANFNLQLFYSPNVTGNAADVVTCNYSPTISFTSIIAIQYSGVATSSPFDVQASGSASGASSVTSGTFTTTAANEIIVAFGRMASGSQTWGAGTIAGSTGNFRQTSNPPTSGVADGEDLSVSSIQTNATAQVLCTNSCSTNFGIVVGTFKNAAGGASAASKLVGPGTLAGPSAVH